MIWMQFAHAFACGCHERLFFSFLFFTICRLLACYDRPLMYICNLLALFPSHFHTFTPSFVNITHTTCRVWGHNTSCNWRRSWLSVYKTKNLKITRTRAFIGLQWQGIPFKDVPGEYGVRFSGETTFGQCACLYAWVGLVVHHWWIGNQCESQKKWWFLKIVVESFITL